MPAQPRLSRLHARFLADTERLRAAFECPRPTDRAIVNVWPNVTLNTSEGCVVRLYDAWNRFCRELVIASAALCPITASGLVLAKAPKISDVADVLPTILLGLKKPPPFGEPRWADAKECLNAAQILGIHNYPTVSAGIGATPSPADDIRYVRNFVAHRNQRTAILLRGIATTYGAPIAQVEGLLRHVVSPGISVFAKWIEELRILAEASIQ